MQVIAVSKSVRQSPRKISLVASLVRGRSVEDAITILEHTPKRAAQAVKKTIESAKANAENNHNLDGKTLHLASLEVGPAASMKRYRPVAHGRAQPFVLRSTNIKVVVEGDEKAGKKTATKSSKKTDEKKTDKTDVKEDNQPPRRRGFKSANQNIKQDVPTTKQRTGIRGNK